MYASGRIRYSRSEKIDKDLFRLVESKDGYNEEKLTLLPEIDTMITEQAVVIKSPPP